MQEPPGATPPGTASPGTAPPGTASPGAAAPGAQRTGVARTVPVPPAPAARVPAPEGTAVAVASALLRRTFPPHGGAGEASWSVGGRGPVEIDADDERAVQAACGVMHVHGRATGAPRPLTADYVSTVTGVLAAQGATACLLARMRGRPGLRARTSLAQGALLSVGQYLAAATAPDAGPDATGDGLATLTTADGVRVEIETLDPLAWSGFWRRLGVDARTAGRGWGPFQRRFGTAVCPLPGDLRAALRRTPLRAVAAAAAESGVALAEVPDTTAAPALVPWTLSPAGHRPVPPPGRPPHEPPPAGGESPPLAGFRVVESTRRVQGPLAGHVLRLLGADVVRIEPPGGDPLRGLPPMAGGCSARFSALNFGKTVTEADLTTARGRETVRELVAGADAFVHNWAPGKADAYGLDADGLHAVRPALVYACASGFGDALGARPPIGTDYLAQVHGGLAAALRPAGEPPAPSLMTVTDVLGGLVLAQAVLAGLTVRERTGHGCRAESSLLSAAALVPRPPGRVALAPLDLPLPTADGLLCLGAHARSHPSAVAYAVGARNAEAVPDRLRTGGTGAWLGRLREAGLPAVPVCTDLAGLAADPAFARAVVAPDASVRHARPVRPWQFEEAGA
ncbi:CoA transferase [Streptomyces sp. AD55]|uniref:CoA transferase n=1 Tax=Streptomyces sp. AD55 TaxID=3242895 RepID=UPI0035288AFA